MLRLTKNAWICWAEKKKATKLKQTIQLEEINQKVLVKEGTLKTIFIIKGFQTIVFIFILFTNPSARAGYDTRSIFKQSLTGLNSEFSFS